MKIDAKRIWLITDTHLGVRSNSREWMDTIEDFFKNQFIPTLKKESRPGDILIHCGDLFDSRQSINLYVMNKGIEIFEEISSIMPVYAIVGNHDIFMKYSNEINSLKLFKHMKNFTVFEEPQVLVTPTKRLLMMPWEEDHKAFHEIISKPEHKADVLFCHTDIKGMSFNKFVKIEDGCEPVDFSGYERVYSGHIHYAQQFKNIRMLGTPYELTRSDSGNQKGFWMLDLETDEEKFYPNERSPKFVRYRLEFILEQDMGWIEEAFRNNYVDIMVTPQWSLKFPFSQFSDSISGYRKINPIILTDGESTEEGAAEQEAGDGEINLITLINDHINNLAYSDRVKENLTKVSHKFYYEAIKEMEEKRNEN
jgi:DNA repair exonuclease SbcCD nuclease subunit